MLYLAPPQTPPAMEPLLPDTVLPLPPMNTHPHLTVSLLIPMERLLLPTVPLPLDTQLHHPATMPPTDIMTLMLLMLQLVLEVMATTDKQQTKDSAEQKLSTSE